MPWLWRPFRGPVWFDKPCTAKGRDEKEVHDEKIDTVKNIHEKKGSENTASNDINRGKSVSLHSEDRKKFTVVFHEDMASKKNSEADTGKTDHRCSDEESRLHGEGEKKKKDTDRKTQQKSGEGGDEGLNGDFPGASILKRFEEIGPGVFSFKSPGCTNRGLRLKEKTVPKVSIPEQSGLPSSMEGFKIMGFTKEGLPIYTIR